MVLRVFLVEDSAAMRAHLIETLVTGASVDVVGIAETEQAAVSWLDHNADRWDVALIDLFLHEGTGAGVIEHCRERRPDQSVLVMSNHARDPDLLRHCKLLGADAVYHKALELDGLVEHCIALAAKKSRNAP